MAAFQTKDLSSLVRLAKGKEIFVVGGSVRDRFLKRPVWDLDLSMPVQPKPFAKTIAAGLKGKEFALDEEREVHRVVLPSGVQIDCSRYQGGSFESDLRRRDFSVNALAIPLMKWNQKNWADAVIDRVRGTADLRKKRLRALSSAVFKEDPLRILRAFRIAAELNFQIDQPTRRWIRRHRRLALLPAAERVREEILRLFSTPESHRRLFEMEKAGVLDVLFPESKRLRRCAHRYYGKGGVLTHSLETVQMLENVVQNLKTWFPLCAKKIAAHLEEPINCRPRIAHLKWAALIHDIGKPETAEIREGRLRFFEHEHKGADRVPDLGRRYRWSMDETRRTERLVRHHMRIGNLATHQTVTDKAIHRFFRDLDDDAVGMLLVSLADHLTYLTPAQRRRRSTSHERLTVKMIHSFYRRRKTILPPKLLNGYDVMKAFGLKPSPLIGALLKDVEEAQSEGRLKNKQDALAYLKTRLPIDRETAVS